MAGTFRNPAVINVYWIELYINRFSRDFSSWIKYFCFNEAKFTRCKQISRETRFLLCRNGYWYLIYSYENSVDELVNMNYISFVLISSHNALRIFKVLRILGS